MSAIIKGETIRVDSADLYKELKNKEGIRDILSDGTTLHIDRAEIVDCVLICEDYVPDSWFEGLEEE